MTGPRLQLRLPDGESREIALQPRTSLGRHPGNSIQLADREVSKEHALIELVGDKIPAEDKTAVQNAVDGLKKAIADNDVPGMTRAMDLLTQMQHKAAESLYRQQQQGGPTPGPGAVERSSPGTERGGTSGDVIDAEVVDEDKK